MAENSSNSAASTGKVSFSIDELVNASTAINAMTPIITSILKSIDKLANVKDLQNNVKNINIISKNVTEYIKGLANIADKLSNISDASIQRLIDFNEAIESDDDDKKAEVKIITAIKSLSSILDTSSKNIEALSKMDFGFTAFMKTQLKIKLLGDSIKVLFATMLDVVKDMNTDANKELIKFLVSEAPAVNKVKHVKKNEHGAVIEENESETTVKEGRTGLIDAVLGFVNVFNTLNDIKTPNLLKTLAKIHILGTQINIVISYMKTMIEDINKVKDIDNTKKILEGVNDILDTFNSTTIGYVQNIIEKFSKLDRISKALSEKRIIAILDLLKFAVKSTINTLAAFVSSADGFMEAAGNVEVVSKVIDELHNMALKLVVIGIVAIPAAAAAVATAVFIAGVRLMMLPLAGMNEELKASIESLKTMATALLILSASLAAIALTGIMIQMIGWQTLMLPMLALGLIVLALTVICNGISEIQTEATHSLVFLAEGIVLIGLTVVAMALVGAAVWEWTKEIMLGFVYVGAVVGLFYLLSKAKEPMMQAVITAALIGIAMVSIGIGLGVFTLIVSHMATIGWDNFFVAMGIIAAFIAVAYAATFASAGVLALMSLGGAMILIAAGLFALSYASKNLSEIDTDNLSKLIWSFIGMAYASILALPGAVAMIAIGGAMIIFAGGIAALAGAYKLVTVVAKDDTSWMSALTEPLKSFIDLLEELANPLTLIAIGLGTASMAMVLASSVMLAAVMLSLLGIVKMAGEINTDMNDDKDYFNKRITQPINGMIDAVLDINVFKAIGASAIIGQLGMSFVKPISGLIDIIQKLSNMTVVDFVDGKHVERRITDQDFETASRALVTIITKFMGIFSDDSVIDAINKIADTGTRKVKKVFNALGAVTSPITDMIGVIKSLAEGRVKMLVTENGSNVEKEVSMMDFISQHQADIENNVKAIVSSFTTAIAAAFENDDILDKIEDTEDAANVIKPLTDSIASMVETAQKLSDSLKADPELLANINKIPDIVGAYTRMLEKGNVLDDSKRKILGRDATAKAFNALDTLVHTANKLGTGEEFDLDKHTKVTDNFIRFIDKANSIDTSKVKTVTEMFREMAEFSKSISGDFEELADVLNDKILDALDKIHGAISNAGAANAPMQPGESFAEANTAQAEREAAAEASAPVDLTEIENQLEEIVSALSYLKSNGIKTHQQYI